MARTRVKLYLFLRAIVSIVAGLFLHPYQTIQSLVSKEHFRWLVLLPVGVFVCAKVVWLFVIVPVVRLVFSCQNTSFVGCDLIPFLADWLFFFCLFWQVMLLYLYWRFWMSWRE